MRNIVAFANEAGNNSFDFDNGTHFVVASVFTSKEKLVALEQEVTAIRQKYFGTSEMSSVAIGADLEKRLLILNELVRLDFSVYVVVVDKRRLYGEGFRYKGSFNKFLGSLVYKELFKTFPDLKLVVDERAHKEFMRDFKKYVLKNHIPDLFAESEFGFMSSPDSILTQLADVIAGSFGYYYDETLKSQQTQQIIDVLRPKITSINYFPHEFKPFETESSAEDKAYNPVIAALSVEKAREFIEDKKVVSMDDADQVNCVRLLLLYFNSYDFKRYISTKEIMRHLQIGRDEPIKEHGFRTRVIAKLRDAGVMIVSSSAGHKTGYKLPASVEDLHKFVNHGNSMIIPMLSRIAKSRDYIRLATGNQIDILDKPDFLELKKLLDEISFNK